MWKFLAFGFLWKPPRPVEGLSFTFLLFSIIYPLFFPTSLPQVTASSKERVFIWPVLSPTQERLSGRMPLKSLKVQDGHTLGICHSKGHGAGSFVSCFAFHGGYTGHILEIFMKLAYFGQTSVILLQVQFQGQPLWLELGNSQLCGLL